MATAAVISLHLRNNEYNSVYVNSKYDSGAFLTVFINSMDVYSVTAFLPSIEERVHPRISKLLVSEAFIRKYVRKYLRKTTKYTGLEGHFTFHVPL